MLFDFEGMIPPERYKLLMATVLPRPIAWITTRDGDGLTNAAPFSFFNVFGSDPATVGIGICSRAPGQPKDTRANIRTRAIRRQLGAIFARPTNESHIDCLPEGRGGVEGGGTNARGIRACRGAANSGSTCIDGVCVHAGGGTGKLQ